MNNKEWSIKFSTLNNEIDDHHKELFQMTEMIDSTIRSTICKDNLYTLICFLEDYTCDHFKEEEALMLEKNFSNIDFHRQEHAYFQARVEPLRAMYERHEYAHAIFQIRQIIDKLVHHIQTVDIQLRKLK